MTIQQDDHRIVRIPVSKYSTPSKGLAFNYVDQFWTYEEETDSVFFWKPDKHTYIFAHPQCNSKESNALHLQKQLYPWGSVRRIPLISVPEDPNR